MESLILNGSFDLWDFICAVYFGSKSWIYIISGVLYMAGLWKMFEKSGLKGWWALIPCAREYQLSRCAGREPEGRLLSVFTFIGILTATFGMTPYAALTGTGMTKEVAQTLVLIIEFAVGIVTIIYSIRVITGLIEVYGVKKRWMVLWILMDAIPAMVWGFNPKYQPAWKVEDIKAELEKLAHQGSADVMDEGLNVNFAKNGSAIEAGKPYLFYSSIGMSSVTIKPAGGLTIRKGARYEDGQTGSVRFTATNRRTPLTAGDKSIIFLNNNHLYYPNSVSGNTMRPFRGYFKVDGAMGVMPRLRIVTGGQTVTEIEGVTESGQQTGARKYIEDGRLVIEREGVRYDATGAKIN